jgi:uncharacterized protein with PQ loop repeat
MCGLNSLLLVTGCNFGCLLYGFLGFYGKVVKIHSTQVSSKQLPLCKK